MSATSALLLLAACAGGEEDDFGYPLSDGENYSLATAIDIPSTATASATDLEICWDELDMDLQCHAMDPVADVDNLGLIRFPHLSQEDVEIGLALDSLAQADLSGYVEIQPGERTCVNLAELNFFGTAIDVPSEYTAEGGTYLLVATTGTDVGVGARAMHFIAPDADETNTSVAIPDACGLLDLTVDLQAMGTVALPADDLRVDWGALTTNMQGQAFDHGDVNTVQIGRYDSLSTSDLESQFLDLELLADATFVTTTEGETHLDLGTLGGDDGAFTGTASGSTWLLSLRCSTCSTPAPLYMVELVAP